MNAKIFLSGISDNLLSFSDLLSWSNNEDSFDLLGILSKYNATFLFQLQFFFECVVSIKNFFVKIYVKKICITGLLVECNSIIKFMFGMQIRQKKIMLRFIFVFF